MDNVINFLLEYYIWILVILGVAIITVIGFLVDSKQKRKGKDKEENSLIEVKTVEPLPEVNEEKSISSIVENNEQTLIDDRAFINEIKEQSKIENNEENIENNVEKTNDNQNNFEQEVALSEQKPHFEPKEINILASSSKESEANIIAPKPVNPVYINNPMQQSVYQQQVPVTPQVNQPMQQPNYQQQVPVTPQVSQPMQQPNYQQQVPVTPQVRQPMQQPNYQQQVQVMPQVEGTVNNSAIQNVSQQQNESKTPIETTSGRGINFVTGNNSNDDDSWNL